MRPSRAAPRAFEGQTTVEIWKEIQKKRNDEPTAWGNTRAGAGNVGCTGARLAACGAVP